MIHNYRFPRVFLSSLFNLYLPVFGCLFDTYLFARLSRKETTIIDKSKCLAGGVLYLCMHACLVPSMYSCTL